MIILCFIFVCFLFFFKQKTAYEMRISDWSSDVCSSDLRFDLEYDRSKAAPKLSNIEIQENYLNALKQLGASVLYTDDDEDNEIVARSDDNGQAIWMEIAIDNNLDEINVHESGRAACRERVCQYV